MNIRKAEPKDIQVIYNFIHSLARYEKREEDATLSLQSLNFWLFQKKAASVLLLIDDKDVPIGYALYYPVFASFAAEAHIHLEDMYILPPYRHQGAGRWFLANITDTLLKEGYTGMEWSALSWNKPAANFYLNIGAEQENNRLYFSLNKENMHALADQLIQIHRIEEMEAAMDRVELFLKGDIPLTDSIKEDISTLNNYYDTNWQKDYEADEQHHIPSFIKRGILSEDGLYNLLNDIDQKLNFR